MRKNTPKNILKKTVKNLLLLLEPCVKKIADFYGIELKKGYIVHGNNTLKIEHDEDSAKRLISNTVVFNTRSGDIFIGRDTMINRDVMFLTGKHLNVKEAEQQNLPLGYVPTSGRDIYVGKGCFICSRAIILGKVKIGDYSVVSAGAVVTKDVPERVIVGGVPAKIIRKL